MFLMLIKHLVELLFVDGNEIVFCCHPVKRAG
jgi:hypothetical protein